MAVSQDDIDVSVWQTLSGPSHACGGDRIGTRAVWLQGRPTLPLWRVTGGSGFTTQTQYSCRRAGAVAEEQSGKEQYSLGEEAQLLLRPGRKTVVRRAGSSYGKLRAGSGRGFLWQWT